MSYAGKINVYICERKHRTVTVDGCDGTTPFMIKCRNWPGGCDEMAQSSMYQVNQDVERPQWEWYSPNDKERLELDPATLDHVKRGGLILRRIDSVRRHAVA